MTIGTTFTRTEHPNNPITIKEIITHRIEKGKKIKLTEDVYILEYEKQITVAENKKVETSMYLKDIKNQLSYNLWAIA